MSNMQVVRCGRLLVLKTACMPFFIVDFKLVCRVFPSYSLQLADFIDAQFIPAAT